MPVCLCGEFFSTTNYRVGRKDDDICRDCKRQSSPNERTEETYREDKILSILGSFSIIPERMSNE